MYKYVVFDIEKHNRKRVKSIVSFKIQGIAKREFSIIQTIE